MFLYLLNLIFTVYTVMLLVRVVGSWFPSFSAHRFMRFLGFYTDPYLNFFRRIIPPLGVIDLSPMIAFIALQVLQTLVFLIIR